MPATCACQQHVHAGNMCMQTSCRVLNAGRTKCSATAEICRSSAGTPPGPDAQGSSIHAAKSQNNHCDEMQNCTMWRKH